MNPTVMGTIAAIIILASFVLRGEKKIRLVNLIGFVFLAIYSVTKEETDFILLFLSVAVVLVHGVQFWSMFKEARTARALAKAEARADEAEMQLKKQDFAAKAELDTKPEEKELEY